MTLLQPDRDPCRPERTDRGALAERGSRRVLVDGYCDRHVCRAVLQASFGATREVVNLRRDPPGGVLWPGVGCWRWRR